MIFVAIAGVVALACNAIGACACATNARRLADAVEKLLEFAVERRSRP